MSRAHPVPGPGPSSWLSRTELLCSLTSLVMNSESFLLFPLFLLQWRGDGLLVYLLILLLIGTPLLIMETSIGKYITHYLNQDRVTIQLIHSIFND